MPRSFLAAMAAVSILISARAGLAIDSLSLAGTWRCRLDPQKVGMDARWFAEPLPESITLPGSTDVAKLGPANARPASLDGLYRLHPYVGPVWYGRDIDVPAGWAGKRVVLFLERAHWDTRAWVDGTSAGDPQDSLVAPHIHDLGSLTPGKHRLVIRADNTSEFDMGGFVSVLYEGTQTNWNGLIGKLELQAVDPVSISAVQVYPDVDHKQARVVVSIENHSGHEARCSLILSATDRASGRKTGPVTVDVVAPDAAATAVGSVPMGDAHLWDEFSPSLCDMEVSLKADTGGAVSKDSRTVAFGMRKLDRRGTQFTMNDRALFLRGTLECGIFPLTGYPPTDVPSWQRIFRVIKSYGLNFMRFHSWCPPDAAFAAADLEGVMLQPEGPQANVNAGSPGRDAFVEKEFLRMVDTYGNHPSFCLMTLGNEYGGPDAILSRWIGMLIQHDSRHLYSSPSSGQSTANRQYTEGGPRGIHGPSTNADFGGDVKRQDRPLTGHEIGQWTFFPNMYEEKKYTGVLAARNFDLVWDKLAAKNMLDEAPLFFQATGKQAVLLYKEEIEVLMRSAGHAGFSLLDLHDYPGQGTALIGLLDPFWDSKGFATPAEHYRYCGPIVPLLRIPKRVYTTDEALAATVDLAQFGPADLHRVEPSWQVADANGNVVDSGKLPVVDAPTGKLTTLGSFTASLAKAQAPCKLNVTVSVQDHSNEWDVWVYPPGGPPAAPADLIVSRQWDDATKAALADGKNVIFFPKVLSSSRSLGGRFLPVFWSPIWFPTQRPNTMGILCDPKHPAFAHFPTEFYSNWQWYDLIEKSRSMILDDTPPTFRPIVQVIDNFGRNDKLGNLFEARVGKGRLIACSMKLPDIADQSPAAAQMLRSLYDYAGSDAFQPKDSLDVALLDSLFAAESNSMIRLGAKIVRVDSEAPDYEAAHILDGDPGTIWHTTWGDNAAPLPHSVVIGFPQPVRATGLVCLPRQDMDNARIKDYRVEASDDDQAWKEIAHGRFDGSPDEKIVRFAQPETFKFLRFTALTNQNSDGPFIAIAELSVIEAK